MNDTFLMLFDIFELQLQFLYALDARWTKGGRKVDERWTKGGRKVDERWTTVLHLIFHNEMHILHVFTLLFHL